MNTRLIIAFFICNLPASFSKFQDVNLRHLLIQYFLVCGGEYFCGNISEITGVNFPNISNYGNLKICAPCKCDLFCLNRGDCCVDMYFSQPVLKCVNRTIIQAKEDVDRQQQSKRLMIASCPTGVSEHVRKLCEKSDLRSKLLHQPVVQYDKQIVYKNRFCAYCHNVSVFKEWAVDINCSKFADFNFLSSLDDVISLAVERECVIQSTDNNIFGTSPPGYYQYNVEICLSKPYQYAKCNITGMWIHYDRDIQYACESPFLGEKRMFRNMFCFMCNPSPGNYDKVIDSCNITGSWNPHDGGLITLCRSLPRSSYTAPFKNVFCFLCNRDNGENKTFLDISGDMTEMIVKDGNLTKYQYDINVSSFDELYFQNFVKKKFIEDTSLNDAIITKDALDLVSSEGRFINITNLFSQYISTMGGIDLCPSRQYAVQSEFLDQCNCDPFCVFGEGGSEMAMCCLDARLDYPTTCRGELALSEIPDSRITKQNYLVTNGCFQASSKRVYFDGCKNRDISDIFSVLPLSQNVTWHDSDVMVNFDNFYCALCNINNTDYATEINSNNVTLQLNKSSTVVEDLHNLNVRITVPWSLEFVCPDILPISYTLLSGDLLKIAQTQKCRIRYVTNVNKSILCYDLKGIDHCDTISDWTFPDNDVKWACLNHSSLDLYHGRYIRSPDREVFDPNDFMNYRSSYRIYRNAFCAICQPANDLGNFSYFIGGCNVTGLHSVTALPLGYYRYHEERCKMSVRTYYYYPYKNIFCALCDGMAHKSQAGGGSSPSLPSYERVPGLNWFPIMRNIFSISDPYGMEYRGPRERCEVNQVHDAFENKCRNISCFPGKISKNSTCVPLFSRTKMLRYTLAIGGRVQHPYLTTIESMMYLIRKVQEYIRESLGIRNLYTEHVYSYFDYPCGSMQSSEISGNIQIYFVIFIAETVSRQSTEETLLNTMTTKVSSANITAQLRPMTEATKLPLLVHTGGHRNECFLYMNPSTAYAMLPYRSVPVSKLLLCPYIVLSSNEFIHNVQTNSVRLKRNDKFLKESFYELQGDDRILICKEELERVGYLMPSANDFSEMKTLWLVSVICSVVSCICLLLAIISYCIFPLLQTIPGIVNMVFILTLLFSLVFNQVGFIIVFNDRGCAVFGLCLHYFWLCVFTTMLVNNFHMNRVFIATISIQQSNTKKLFARYMIFSFGVPLVFVLINIGHAYLDRERSFLGYGGQKCFISNIILLIVTFITPIATIIVINTILFIVTSISVLNTPDIRSNQSSRNDLQIILRMSTITGICWFAHVIDSFFSLSVLSYVSSILTCSQGMFVFLAFIGNSRVWQMYKIKLLPKNSGNTDTSKNCSKRQTMGTTEGM